MVFEGGDGTGTSTQCEMIKKNLEEAGKPYFTTFEPTGGPIGKTIRAALKGDISLMPETIARLFAADRNEHLYQARGILDHCGRNEIVVSDRYTPSSLVYQGIECGEALPAKLNGDFPLPELLVYFDIDPQTALDRIGKRRFRDSYEYLDFQVEVHKRYRTILEEYRRLGVTVEIIDASKTVEEVARDIWSSVRKLPIFET